MTWCKDEKETGKLASDFAAGLKPGDLVYLSGPLGAGKSVFARSLIRTLMNAPDLEVPSPTFTLVQLYEMADREIWHFDLYRLKRPEHIYELGLEEALANGIALVEWPERLENLGPSPQYRIDFETAGPEKSWRHVLIKKGSQ